MYAKVNHHTYPYGSSWPWPYQLPVPTVGNYEGEGTDGRTETSNHNEVKRDGSQEKNEI